MKLFKWLFGLVFVFVIIIAGALIILPMVVDPNDYKEQIVQVVKDKTGRDLAINAPIDLSVFPWLGVAMGDVRLSKAAGFGDDPFLEVGVLDVKVKLLPLLKKKIEIDQLVLTDLMLHLETNQQGITSWQDLQAAGAAESKPESSSSTDGYQDGGLAGFDIGGIAVKNAMLRWDDATKGEQIEIKGINLETGALRPDQAFDASLALALARDAGSDQIKMNLEFISRVLMNERFSFFLLNDTQLNLAAQGNQVPGGKAVLSLETPKLQVNLDGGDIELADLKITGPDIAVTGSLSAKNISKAPKVNGQLAIAETNLKNLLSILGTEIQTTDSAALTKVSANLTIQATDKTLSLNPLKVVLDDSTLDGTFSLNDFNGPDVSMDLQLDQIDLDRYMPPKSENSAENVQSEKVASTEQDALAPLRPLKLDAKFNLGKLKVSNMKMSQMKINITSDKGVLKVSPMQANLYQGQLDGQVTLNAQKKTPVLRVNKKLAGVQIGDLLKDLTGEDKISGNGEVNMNLSMKGLDETSIRQTLNGTVDFKFRDGAYKGFNLAELIRKAQGQGGSSGVPQTDFAELSASATMTNGLVENKDLKGFSPLLRVNGAGKVNLPENTIDYKLTTKIVGTLEGQGGAVGDKLKGVPIGVRLTGNLDQPKPEVDLSGVLNAKAQEAIDKKKKKILEKVGDKAGGELDKVFKGLFR